MNFLGGGGFLSSVKVIILYYLYIKQNLRIRKTLKMILKNGFNCALSYHQGQ